MTTGQLLRPAFAVAIERHQLQHVRNALLAFRLGHTVLLQAEGDVVFDGHVREQRVRLEHHVHGPFVGRNARHILAVDEQATFGRVLKTGQHAQQRGLAAARGTQQTEGLALVDVEAHLIDGDKITEPLGDALDAHIRHRLRVLPRLEFLVRTRVGHVRLPLPFATAALYR